MSKQTVILSIDDDEQICYALNALFRFQGWLTLSAHDVTNGLQLFVKHSPDIVLIDYHMPGVNGIRGVEMIRELNSDVPIIVFTIDESQALADRFLEAGASDFALKPIKAPDIVSRIKLHLRLIENGHLQTPSTPSFVVKGIGRDTLELIESFLANSDEFFDVSGIAKGTGLAEQTVYRYLQYLAQSGGVEVKTSYGKVGRPKQQYRSAIFKR